MTTPYPSNSPQRVMIASFEGWSDAGSATSIALEHLTQFTQAEVLHAIDTSSVADLQLHRPRIYFDDSGNRKIAWPETQLYGTVNRPADESVATNTKEVVRYLDGSPVRDLFFLTGIEPARDWINFSAVIVDLVKDWQIEMVIIIGSLYSDAPHSRPIITTVSSDDAELRQRFSAERSDYEGPIGITTVLDLALTKAGVPVVSLWAQVPHYVHSSPSPKATLAILDKLEELLNVVIPRGELLQAANDWEANINRIAQSDDDMAGYIRALEEARDAALAPETTGEAIAYEFEKFLGREPDEDPENNR